MKKNIFILGGNSGIGLEISQLLSQNPRYRLFVLGQSSSKLKIIKTKLNVETYQIDIRKITQINKLTRWIKNKKLSVDVLISTAGIFSEKELDLENEETIMNIIDINFKGNALLFKAFIPLLKDRENSHLIYINSGMGLKPNPGKAIYAASKWAMAGLMQSLEMELSRYGIKVTSLYPNKTKTAIFRDKNKDLSNALEPSEIAKVINFILDLDPHTVISDITMKHLNHSTNAIFKKKKIANTFILERQL